MKSYLSVIYIQLWKAGLEGIERSPVHDKVKYLPGSKKYNGKK
jgi:hypothetical protein